MNPRDIPEVVAELIYEMHEVRSELNILNGRVDRLEQTVGRLEQTVEKDFKTCVREFRDEMRQNTDRLIDAFSRSMAPLIDRVLTHEDRINRLETPQG